MPLFPNVPALPGVPALPRAVGTAIAFVELLVGDAVSLFPGADDPLWGLFLDGEPAIVADTVVSVDYRQDWTLPTYPIEQGAFENYNKVQTPFGVKVSFATGGSTADKEEFLASIAAAVSSLDLYDVVTPEAIYTSVNPIHYDYRRSALRGVGMMVVDLWVMEVRVTATAAFSNTDQSSAATTGAATPASTTDITTRPGGTTQIASPQSPSASPQVNDGNVQPVSIQSSPSIYDAGAALP